MAASEKDIENIIKMLDEASATTARINLNVAEMVTMVKYES